MRAMILAAGRGQRMRPLTDETPKPLLKVDGKPLIEYHLENLKEAGVQEVVINHAWLGHKLESHLGDGSHYGMQIHWSAEPAGGLETGGGIIKALPFLGRDPFWVVNGDIWTNFSFNTLPQRLDGDDLGHLILVKNPIHNEIGDFALKSGRVVMPGGERSYTFSGISLLNPQLFHGTGAQRIALKPFLSAAIQQDRLSGSVFEGAWTDVGTPQRLAALSQEITSQKRRGRDHVG